MYAVENLPFLLSFFLKNTRARAVSGKDRGEYNASEAYNQMCYTYYT
jgi:hypothetical protein